MFGLTKRQHETVAWIERYVAEHGHSPTMREIGDGTGVCHVTAWERVQALVRRGALVAIPRGPRSVRLAEPARKGVMR